MDGIRQKQIGQELQAALSAVLQHVGHGIYGNALVSILRIVMTRDLSLARCYMGVMNAADAGGVLQNIRLHKNEIRKELAGRVRYQVRRIPDLEFYLDDTLEEMFRMEALFKSLKKKAPVKTPGKKSRKKSS